MIASRLAVVISRLRQDVSNHEARCASTNNGHSRPTGTITSFFIIIVVSKQKIGRIFLCSIWARQQKSEDDCDDAAMAEDHKNVSAKENKSDSSFVWFTPYHATYWNGSRFDTSLLSSPYLFDFTWHCVSVT